MLAGLWGGNGETEQLQAETDLFDATQSQYSWVYTGCMGVTKACQQSAVAWL